MISLKRCSGKMIDLIHIEDLVSDSSDEMIVRKV